ncbi:MAG: hypothetical protein WCJ74_01885 [bacterium]
MEPQQTGNSQNNNNDQIKIIPTPSGGVSPVSNSTAPVYTPPASTPAFVPTSTPKSEETTFKPNTGMNISSEQKSEEKIVFEPQSKISISPLHTYADDIKNTIKDDGLSMAKIAMAEVKKQEAQEKVEEELSPTSEKNKKIIGISLGILLLAVLGVFGAWYFVGIKKAQNISSIPAHMQSIIPYDEGFTVILDTSERSKIVEGVNSAKKQSYDKNTAVVYIPFMENTGTTTSPINTERFLSLLQTRASLAMVRSFGTSFMFGLNRNAGQTNSFLILTSDSFNQMYAGMLEWEPAMADDIGDLFFTKDDLVEAPAVASTSPLKVATNTVATSTTATSSIATTTIVLASSTPATSTVPEMSLVEQKAFKSRYIIANSLVFKDEVLNNRDMRVLRTVSGKTLMYYTFINDKIVLIAKDFNTLDEVAKRLATSQFKQ